MVRRFVLIDAVPGMEEALFTSLDEVEAVVGKAMLDPKIENHDVLILVEAPNDDDVRKILSTYVRGIAGVGSLMTVDPRDASRSLRRQAKALADKALS